MRAAILLALCAVIVAVRSEPECEIANDLERFDCHPEDNANEDRCTKRGCCWRASSAVTDSPKEGLKTTGLPSCYYPKNYEGYKILNKTETGIGLTAYLQRVTASQIDKDIDILKVEVIEHTREIVRIRIIDPTTLRWQPPYPKPPAPGSPPGLKYKVELTANNKLEVTRVGGVKLVSFDLTTLVYTDRFIQVTSELPSQFVYGLGEHKGSLLKGTDYTKFSFYNKDASPAYNTRLYGTHPLYINIESDGQANGMWLFNSNAQDIILHPKPAITYRPVGGVLDFFVFAGPTPAEVVQQYQKIVGKPKMVPYWALGFHLCRWGYNSTENTKKILQKNLDAGVRIDVQWNDIDYMNDRNDFTVDPNNYHDLGDFVDSLHKDGRHYVLIVDPAVSGSEKPGTYPPYERGLEYDVFVKDTKGEVVKGKVWNLKSSVFPDFTHPNATPYWTEMFSDFHKQVAFDGAWIDMNEPANLISGHLDEGCPDDPKSLVYTPGDEPLINKTLCMTDKHHWSEHYNVHNMYGFTEAMSTYDALTAVRPNKRPFIISRSSFSGHGFYAGHWTGDIYSTWQDLKDSVPAILEFSFYGMPLIGADICGFVGNTTMDLCARWQAVGAFYPFSRNHNTIDTFDQDPASLGGKVLTVVKNVYYWRYKLIPYLYTLFYKAHIYGETVARPLFFDYPQDPMTYKNDEQFFWGDALMVVPALHENQKKIDAYFPDGIWFDLQNRTGVVDASGGGKTVSLEAYEDTINFFMKGGSAVFFQEPGKTTTDSRQNPFGVYVFLGNERTANGEVYIDDGESIDAIEKRQYALVSAVANNQVIEISNNSGTTITNKLDRVHAYGIIAPPKSILVNYKPTTDFQYDAKLSLLSIYNINLAMQGINIQIVY